jgi:hypothetical protein
MPRGAAGLQRRRRQRRDELEPPGSWVTDQVGLVAVVLDRIAGSELVRDGAELDPQLPLKHEDELLRLMRGRFGAGRGARLKAPEPDLEFALCIRRQELVVEVALLEDQPPSPVRPHHRLRRRLFGQKLEDGDAKRSGDTLEMLGELVPRSSWLSRLTLRSVLAARSRSVCPPSRRSSRSLVPSMPPGPGAAARLPRGAMGVFYSRASTTSMLPLPRSAMTRSVVSSPFARSIDELTLPRGHR